jgi:hypothetical protein
MIFPFFRNARIAILFPERDKLRQLKLAPTDLKQHHVGLSRRGRSFRLNHLVRWRRARARMGPPRGSWAAADRSLCKGQRRASGVGRLAGEKDSARLCRAILRKSDRRDLIAQHSERGRVSGLPHI